MDGLEFESGTESNSKRGRSDSSVTLALLYPKDAFFRYDSPRSGQRRTRLRPPRNPWFKSATFGTAFSPQELRLIHGGRPVGFNSSTPNPADPCPFAFIRGCPLAKRFGKASRTRGWWFWTKLPLQRSRAGVDRIIDPAGTNAPKILLTNRTPRRAKIFPREPRPGMSHHTSTSRASARRSATSSPVVAQEHISR